MSYLLDPHFSIVHYRTKTLKSDVPTSAQDTYNRYIFLQCSRFAVFTYQSMRQIPSRLPIDNMYSPYTDLLYRDNYSVFIDGVFRACVQKNQIISSVIYRKRNGQTCIN